MKIKILFLFICLSSFISIYQIDDNQFYSVVIFKVTKDSLGNQQKKIILVNQEGEIIINNKMTNFKVNLNDFTKGINEFIEREKLPKESAYNGLPKVISIPSTGQTYICITIIKMQDFINEKEFDNNSKYISRKVTKSPDENIDLYKYLKSGDLKILKNAIK